MDLSVFKLKTQTTDGDRTSLLMLQDVIEKSIGDYTYLEIGSFLGGTLLPHLHSKHCTSIVSIDKRVNEQWDERQASFSYENITTEEMLRGLSEHVSESDMPKLTTMDGGSEVLEGKSTPKIDFSFIDAEHTVTAAFRDFRYILPLMKEKSVIGFHDTHLVIQAVRNCEEMLKYLGVSYALHFLPDHVAAMFVGDWTAEEKEAIATASLNEEEFAAYSTDFLIRSTILHNLERFSERDSKVRKAVQRAGSNGKRSLFGFLTR